MKKIFAVGMAALLLAGACTFAACDEEEDNTVTAEEWAQAMNLQAVDNYTYKVSWINEESTENKILHKYDGLKWFQSFQLDKYYEITGVPVDTYHDKYPCKEYVSGGGNQWSCIEDSGVYYWDDIGTVAIYTTMLYEDFSYDEEKCCYVAQGGIHVTMHGEIEYTEFDEGFLGVEVQFKDKKLARIDLIVSFEGVTEIERMEIYDYGTTVVTLPTVG